MSNLSLEQAYAAMYAFLEKQCIPHGSDEIRSLLGSMSLLAPSNSIDPAIWDDWLAAVAQAQSGHVSTQFSVKRGG